MVRCLLFNCDSFHSYRTHCMRILDGIVINVNWRMHWMCVVICFNTGRSSIVSIINAIFCWKWYNSCSRNSRLIHLFWQPNPRKYLHINIVNPDKGFVPGTEMHRNVEETELTVFWFWINWLEVRWERKRIFELQIACFCQDRLVSLYRSGGAIRHV